MSPSGTIVEPMLDVLLLDKPCMYVCVCVTGNDEEGEADGRA